MLIKKIKIEREDHYYWMESKCGDSYLLPEELIEKYRKTYKKMEAIQNEITTLVEAQNEDD